MKEKPEVASQEERLQEEMVSAATRCNTPKLAPGQAGESKKVEQQPVARIHHQKSLSLL